MRRGATPGDENRNNIQSLRAEFTTLRESVDGALEPEAVVHTFEKWVNDEHAVYKLLARMPYLDQNLRPT